jgi:SAM-dependent methyltransferase
MRPNPRYAAAGFLKRSEIFENLERDRESRWERQGRASDLKLNWRALFLDKFLHILPGEEILEFGAGSGALTARLSEALRGRNPITAVVFSPELLERARSRHIANAHFVAASDFFAGAPSESFDFVVGSGMLWHSGLQETLEEFHRVLKPGGQILFFEPNLRLPARLCNEMVSRRGEMGFHASPEQVVAACEERGFSGVTASPHDIVSCRFGYRLMRRIQAKAVLVEHMPALRSACGSMCVSARKPGDHVRPKPNLAEHPQLRRAVSVVVPAHNEESNIQTLVDGLLGFYGDYIHEIVIVNDNSSDRTAEAVLRAARKEPRVRLVNRTGPNGVGRALRDGYQAATGRYILSMDCDFVAILPEFRGLFDAVAQGRDGAIGSRFSHESVLLNYPFAKMVSNRVCHLLIKTFLLDGVRDLSNNLKLYRADILRNLEIQSPFFAANLETGLKPMLRGYDIAEVPISWINRTPEMGSSSFHLRRVCADYAKALYRCWRGVRQRRGTVHLMLRNALARFGFTLRQSPTQ